MAIWNNLLFKLNKAFPASLTNRIYPHKKVIGCPIDCCCGTTDIVAGNALNPSWDETFEFGVIHTPSLAVLRISVYNQGIIA